jgi:hypothetical protein
VVLFPVEYIILFIRYKGQKDNGQLAVRKLERINYIHFILAWICLFKLFFPKLIIIIMNWFKNKMFYNSIYTYIRIESIEEEFH